MITSRASRADFLTIAKNALGGVAWAASGCLWASTDGGTNCSQALQVSRSGREIRIVAEQAPLGQVLEQIAAQMAVRVHNSLLPQPRISAVCSGETVEQMVSCLFGPSGNFVLRRAANGGSSGQAADLWVLSASVAEASERPGQRDSCSEVGTSIVAAAKQPEPWGTERLLDLATAEDPVRREQGLSRLAAEGSGDDVRVRQTLQNALSDPDASVRAQAVAGLARQGGEDVASVLQQALHDGDASVRLMAVDNAGIDAEGLALLQQALNDGDETVRALAAMKLDVRPDHGHAE